jgi:very-short-patch-repair endonuclease
MSKFIEHQSEESPEPGILVQPVLSAGLNLAAFQNSIPLIRELRIVANDLEEFLQESDRSDGDLSNVELTVTSEPAFHQAKTWRIDSLSAGQSVRISDLDLKLDGTLFHRLTEAEMASVKFVLTAGGHAEPLAQVEIPVELLPRNQWGGTGQLPDLLAAFVQPNDPAVERVLKQASGILASSGKSSALDGYQGGAKRAWELVSAIWTSFAALNLDYALPPASFEATGQKVRSPGQIVGSGLATCLDLSLFFCAALEQAGLNPILVLTKGHAFAGAWLRSEDFSAVIVDDITALRKRVMLKEMVLFETTLLTGNPPPPFSFAVSRGIEHLSEGNESGFVFALDVHRARMHRIKPLASAESLIQDGSAVSAESVMAPVFEEAPDIMDEPDTADEELPALDPNDRLGRWQRKLLDLSLRNPLLNFKEGKKSVRLEVADPGWLEDKLAAGESFKILPMPVVMDGSDPRSQAIHEGRDREDLRREVMNEGLRRKELFVGLTQEEMEGRLVEQFRSARSSMEEGGANTLYLAMGFLTWIPADKSKQLRAPLVLIPVTLSRRSVRSGFSITLHEDEPRFNPTLLEMLRQDFGLNLGVNDGELPTDDSGLDIVGIWKTVSRAIKDIKGWDVREDVVLAMFSFSKHLMWKDLTSQIDNLRENPVVKHLVDSPRETYPSDVAFPDPKRLDRDYRPEQVFCPLQADSSQLSAVLAASRGKDFVLIGPPGTGKSQTIANIIAQCLAEGKKVLFVSEKIAALDVVHRRLREVGLGEFCLEIHSNKARKVDVLHKLEASWRARGEVDQSAWKAEAERLLALREQLNAYVERMHTIYPNGWTIYRAIAKIVGGEGLPRLGLSWASHDVHGKVEMAKLRDLVDCLAVNAQAVGQTSGQTHALGVIQCSDWSPVWQQKLVGSANNLARQCHTSDVAFQRLASLLSLPQFRLTHDVRVGLTALIETLPEAYGRDWRFALLSDAKKVVAALGQGLDLLEQHRALNHGLSSGWPKPVVDDCRRGLALLAQRQDLLENLGTAYSPDVVEQLKKGLGLLDNAESTIRGLSVTYSDQVETLDVFQLQRDWNKAEASFWPISWARKRAVQKILESVAISDAIPNAALDVHALAKLSALYHKMSAIDIGALTDGVWAGKMSNRDNVQALLAFQAALNCLKRGEAWEDKGLERITEGRCGERVQKQLAAMRKVACLETALAALDHLALATEGLWEGLATNPVKLDAALNFVEAMGQVRDSGPIAGDHQLVGRKECGSTLARDLAILSERTLVENRLAELNDLGAVTSGLWDGLKTDVAESRRAIAFVGSITKAVSLVAPRSEEGLLLAQSLEKLLGPANHILSPAGPGMSAARECVTAFAGIQPVLEEFVTVGQIASATRSAMDAHSTSEIAAQCQGIAQNEGRLKAWCAWQKARQEAIAVGLGPVVEALEEGVCAAANVRDVFEVDYCQWWASAVVDQEDVVRSFVSAEHEKRINDFRALDDRFTRLTRDWVRASLCSGIPHPDEITKKNREWGLLRYEMSKKKRHMPLRSLLRDAKDAVSRLAPCLLMSPLSIAQYLEADTTAFDIVVFDEASQIPIWDAIGAIARGKQVVMVGDPKQLPPTNFFNRADGDGDDCDIEEDLESILDECIGANLPTLNLNWHYRSRNESLIAFSNHHYYGGSLVTFPSPATKDCAVSYHKVAGIYEKGGARINQAEAQSVVAEVVRQLKTKADLSVGIVTFNAEQQGLIENLLDEERRKYPWIEPYFSDSELEPVFVKNLESVQGDERDIIFFSTTYGPDNSGVVSMNFGPMNRTGGERRLNVAITRARHELRVFSSLRSEQIDLSRTQSIGVRDLKYFLDFADRGQRAIAEETRVGSGGYDSPFEEGVANALIRKGWVLHSQVGVSAYRIDLGVVHPDAPGTFLAGIECDGATYHRSATARDRDMLRESVLRDLGWEIVRVWSTDWWVDPTTTLEILHQRLEDLLAASREKRRAVLEATVQADVGEEITPFGVDGSELDGLPAGGPLDSEQVSDAVFATNQSSLPPSLGFAFEGSVDPNRFFEPSYDNVLSKIVASLIEAEGPIHEERLARQIARMHGWQRTGARIQARVGLLATHTYGTTQEDVGRFYWPKHLADMDYVPMRKGLDKLGRNLNEIAMPELVSLCRAYVEAGVDASSAIIQVARDLGLSRLKSGARERLELAMQQATDEAS